MSAPDGSNAVQLTTLKSLPGFARWTPDGETLAFHSDPEGHPDVLTVRASRGTPRILTIGSVSGGYPSYSRDGRWVYFVGQAADGQLRVQKIPTGGGPPIQLTSTPGAIPTESYDGRDLYYLEAAERPSALWRLPVSGGGAPTRVLDDIVNGAYDVVERGIYCIDRVSADPGSFFGERQTGETRLRYFDFATGQTTTIATGLGTLSLGLSASRDGRTVFSSKVDSSADELILVENFR